MSAKRVVRRALLDRTARPLLVRLLTPYAEFFAARGLSLAALSTTAQTDRGLVREVFRILYATPGETPPELLEQLATFEGLANPSGQRSLYELCPPLAQRGLGYEDTAMVVVLDHPEILPQARRVADAAGVAFTDFDAASDRDPLLSSEALAALVAGFRVWLVRRGRKELCDLHLTESDDEVHLEIEHGRPPATDDIVGEELELTQVTVVRVERAILVFDRESCRLSVYAGHAAIKELLRRLVGEHLFGHADHFRRSGAYSLEPLASDLDAALAYEDVPGIKGAVLLGITVNGGDERVTRETIEKSELRKTRRARELYDVLADGGVVEWFKVRLELEGARAVVFELSSAKKKIGKVPEKIERLVDEWLIARGFLAAAPRRRSRHSDASGLSPSQAASQPSSDADAG